MLFKTKTGKKETSEINFNSTLLSCFHTESLKSGFSTHQFGLATFQLLNSHMALMAPILDSVTLSVWPPLSRAGVRE